MKPLETISEILKLLAPYSIEEAQTIADTVEHITWQFGKAESLPKTLGEYLAPSKPGLAKCKEKK